jgi:ABC-type branched-subunit amino acid transport system substrate-binding protein
LNAFTDECPQHASAAEAKLLLQSLENQQQGKTWKIGVLVPKTGRFKSFGQSVLNGITLAMEQANQAGGSRKPMALVVQDTMGDAIQAVKVFQEMTKDDSLDAVIGPVGSAEIQAVAPLTNERRITLISPAMSRDGLSSLGPYLFSNGMTNEMQGRVIARFAVEKLGLRKFGILAPEDGYGETLSDAFKKTVESMGATVTASQTYPPTATDFKKQLVALGGQDPETSKESERDNNRKLEELKYNMKKEVGKILLKAREAGGGSSDSGTSQAVAFIPFTEGLTNTTCASVVKGINDALKVHFQDQKDLPVRNDDLVHQVMERLPVEYRGTTLPVSADVWGDLAGDLDASLLVTGRVIQTNPPNDWSDDATWDFYVVFEAFQWNPKRGTFSKVYQSRLLYSTYKPASLIRVNSNMQALYLPAHSVEIPSLASQIHFYDMNPVFLGGHLWDNEAVRKDAAKDVEGAYFVTGFYPDSQQGAARKFSEDYLKRFAKRPDLLAAQAFDAARLLLRATQESLSRDDIHNRLMGIRDFDGASGRASFNGKGEAEKVVPVIRIQDGKYQQVQ